MPTNFQLGVMFRCQNAPETLIDSVRQAEAAGLDEIWIVEDCFFAGGIASVATALATTERITVGLGIMPAVARNPAFTAMEVAALCRLYPGRFLPGLGHGVADWMRQIGAFPESQLAALEETTVAVRDLLAGQRVDMHGRHVQLDGVQLAFSPAAPPPISLGVRGPKSLQLSGRVAGGTIIPECSAPAYARWTREQIAEGQRKASREGEPHRLTAYAFCLIDDDTAAAYAALRPVIAHVMAVGGIWAQLAPMGIIDEVKALLNTGGEVHLAQHMPDDWIRQLAVAGTPSQCKDAIDALVDAGVDSVILVPVVDDHATVDAIATRLLPLFT